MRQGSCCKYLNSKNSLFRIDARMNVKYRNHSLGNEKEYPSENSRAVEKADTQLTWLRNYHET